jgi:uroporphyrin-III C-methyltransferase
MTKKVYLIGAGPGDPELLTIKAARILAAADAVVYDNLISDEILAHIPKTAEMHYAGKQKSKHTLQQGEINSLLVELGLRDDLNCVVRLKGGDPFIFGRGGEEVEELVKAGLEFEVVPGITAAAACGASLGLPLTHRDYVSGVHFFTGHGCKELEPSLKWEILAAEDKTLCVYMGLTNAQIIVDRLIEHGMAGDMPAAVVENGTLANQRHEYTILRDLPQVIEQGGFASPALIIIGKVVGFAQGLRS